jgi:hypothetical protein
MLQHFFKGKSLVLEVSVMYTLIQQVGHSNCANLLAENLNTRKNKIQVLYTENPNTVCFK